MRSDIFQSFSGPGIAARLCCPETGVVAAPNPLLVERAGTP